MFENAGGAISYLALGEQHCTFLQKPAHFAFGSNCYYPQNINLVFKAVNISYCKQAAGSAFPVKGLTSKNKKFHLGTKCEIVSVPERYEMP